MIQMEVGFTGCSGKPESTRVGAEFQHLVSVFDTETLNSKLTNRFPFKKKKTAAGREPELLRGPSARNDGARGQREFEKEPAEEMTSVLPASLPSSASEGSAQPWRPPSGAARDLFPRD